MLVNSLVSKYNFSFSEGSLFKFDVTNSLGIYLKLANSELSKISFICIGYAAHGVKDATMPSAKDIDEVSGSMYLGKLS